MAHRVGCVRRTFEQSAFYIEGRRRVRARARGTLRIELDFFARASFGETGEQLGTIHAGALGDLHEWGARLRELGPVVLMLVERIMRRPEPALARGAHRDFG